MASFRQPPDPGHASDADFEVTIGGWDPYVASLLGTDSTAATAPVSEEDDSQPVMTISRRSATSPKE